LGLPMGLRQLVYGSPQYPAIREPDLKYRLRR